MGGNIEPSRRDILAEDIEYSFEWEAEKPVHQPAARGNHLLNRTATHFLSAHRNRFSLRWVVQYVVTNVMRQEVTLPM
jgi:hypothetical protein